MSSGKSRKLPIIAIVVLVLFSAIGYMLAYQGARSTENVMTAGSDLAAYSFVNTDSLEATAVPKASITETDLTEDEYNEQYAENGLVLTTQLLAGQRIDTREIAEGAQESFSVVLPSERVIATTTTLPGAAVGTIRAGDVVDVSTEGGEDASNYAKVICIASTAAGCKGVLPPGVDLSATSGESTGEVNVLLAVDQADATQLAGQPIVLSLNPFCKVSSDGAFEPAREGVPCGAPSRGGSIEESDLSEEPSTTPSPEG